MSKIHQYFITEELKELLGKPIRNKDDLLIVLLEISSYLLVNDKPISRGYGEFKIYIDKMSRVFITLMDGEVELKHFSFNFPFIIVEERLDSVININLLSKKNRFRIDSVTISILKSLLSLGWFSNDGDMSNSCMLDHYVTLERSLTDLVESPENYIDEIWWLIKELILMEPGYLRYDFDTEHENGKLHPLHHLDINYTNNVTFKLGLPSSCRHHHFVDLLDLKTDCRFLS